jgi:GDP-mannose 4,6-dehydratase
MSNVGISFKMPVYTQESNYLGFINLLEVIRATQSKEIKVYQASSSEMFGNCVDEDGFQRENTPMIPVSPYGVSKLSAHLYANHYRRAYKMNIWCGILFNHESPRRGTNFVTGKVAKSVAQINAGIIDKIQLGTLDTFRDWGHSKDYCIDLETSILTPNGYLKRDELNINDEVINYNLIDNNWQLDRITNIYDVEHIGKMITFKGARFEFRCSPNHRMFYQQKSKKSKNWNGSWKEISAKDLYEKFNSFALRTKYDYRFPAFAGIKQDDFDISDDMLVLIGYLVTEGCLSRSEIIGSGFVLSVSQSSKKYLQDLINCITNLNLEYRQVIRNDDVNEFIFSAKSRDLILEYFDRFDIHELPSFIYKLSIRQSTLLMKTMMNCDGCWTNGNYSSKRLKLAEQFYDLCNLSGYQSSINKRKYGGYTVGLLRHAKHSVHQNITDVIIEDVAENIWCIETEKNGTIITKGKNGRFVSGNCKVMWQMLNETEPDDFICCTGITHSVKVLCKVAFERIGINDFSNYIEILDKYKRDEELNYLRGCSDKLFNKINVDFEYTFEKMIHEMVDYHISNIKIV